MKKLTFEQKKNLSGGVAASTIAWIAILGMSMLFSGVNSFVNNLTSSSSNSRSSYSASSRSNMMLRMSPIPTRSTLNFWI